MIVFSTLFNEDEAFLRAYLANFVRFTDEDCRLVVNVSPDAAVGDLALHQSARAHLFRSAAPRLKYGADLLFAHLDNLEAALARHPGAELFCTLASNALFFRPVDRGAVQGALCDPPYPETHSIDELPDGWWWPWVSGNPALIRSLREDLGLDRLASGQLEGLLAAVANWRLLLDLRPELQAAAELARRDPFPFEEVFPPTLFKLRGDGRYLNLCHNWWRRWAAGDGVATLGDLIGAENLPPHVCLQKWFVRAPDAPATALVSTAWGGHLRAALMEAAKPGFTEHAALSRLLREAAGLVDELGEVSAAQPAELHQA